MPDLIGYKIKDVIELFKHLGINHYDIIITKPPRDKEEILSDDMRTLRIKEENNILKVLVCR